MIFVIIFCMAVIGQEKKEICPVISVRSPNSMAGPGETETFTVSVEGSEKYNLSYSWAVSEGRIVWGQNTPSIKVLRYDCNAAIAATVEIKGLPESCPNTASESSVIADGCGGLVPEKIDEYSKILFEKEKEKIDTLFSKLRNDEYLEGFIVLPDNKDLVKRLEFFKSYFNLKGYDPSRFTIVISDKEKSVTTLWIVSSYSTRIDCDNCLTFKAEDYEKLEKLFTPKPKTKRKNK